MSYQQLFDHLRESPSRSQLSLPDMDSRFRNLFESMPSELSCLLKGLLVIKNVFKLPGDNSREITLNGSSGPPLNCQLLIKVTLHSNALDIKFGFKMNSHNLESIRVDKFIPQHIRHVIKLSTIDAHLSLQVRQSSIHIGPLFLPINFNVNVELGLFSLKSIDLPLKFNPKNSLRDSIEGSFGITITPGFKLGTSFSGLTTPRFIAGGFNQPMRIEDMLRGVLKQQISIPAPFNDLSVQDTFLFADLVAGIYFAKVTLNTQHLDIFPSDWCKLDKITGHFAKLPRDFDFKLVFEGKFLTFPFALSLYHKKNFRNQKKWVLPFTNQSKTALNKLDEVVKNFPPMQMVNDELPQGLQGKMNELTTFTRRELFDMFEKWQANIVRAILADTGFADLSIINKVDYTQIENLCHPINKSLQNGLNHFLREKVPSILQDKTIHDMFSECTALSVELCNQIELDFFSKIATDSQLLDETKSLENLFETKIQTLLEYQDRSISEFLKMEIENFFKDYVSQVCAEVQVSLKDCEMQANLIISQNAHIASTKEELLKLQKATKHEISHLLLSTLYRDKIALDNFLKDFKIAVKAHISTRINEVNATFQSELLEVKVKTQTMCESIKIKLVQSFKDNLDALNARLGKLKPKIKGKFEEFVGKLISKIRIPLLKLLRNAVDNFKSTQSLHLEVEKFKVSLRTQLQTQSKSLKNISNGLQKKLKSGVDLIDGLIEETISKIETFVNQGLNPLMTSLPSGLKGCANDILSAGFKDLKRKLINNANDLKSEISNQLSSCMNIGEEIEAAIQNRLESSFSSLSNFESNIQTQVLHTLDRVETLANSILARFEETLEQSLNEIFGKLNNFLKQIKVKIQSIKEGFSQHLLTITDKLDKFIKTEGKFETLTETTLRKCSDKLNELVDKNKAQIEEGLQSFSLLQDLVDDIAPRLENISSAEYLTPSEAKHGMTIVFNQVCNHNLPDASQIIDSTILDMTDKLKADICKLMTDAMNDSFNMKRTVQNLRDLQEQNISIRNEFASRCIDVEDNLKAELNSLIREIQLIHPEKWLKDTSSQIERNVSEICMNAPAGLTEKLISQIQEDAQDLVTLVSSNLSGLAKDKIKSKVKSQVVHEINILKVIIVDDAQKFIKENFTNLREKLSEKIKKNKPDIPRHLKPNVNIDDIAKKLDTYLSEYDIKNKKYQDVANTLKTISAHSSAVKDCYEKLENVKRAFDAEALDLCLNQPITAHEVLELLRKSTSFDLNQLVSQEITKKIRLEEFIVALENKAVQSFLLTIASANEWKIFDFLTLRNIKVKLSWTKGAGIQNLLLQSQFNSFSLLATYDERKNIVFQGALAANHTFNPLKMIRNVGISVPDFLTGLTNFTDCSIAFSPKRFFALSLTAQTNLQIISFVDNNVKLNKYQLELHSNMESKQTNLKLVGDMTLFRIDVLFTVLIKSKQDFQIEARTKTDLNLLNFLLAVTQQNVELPGITIEKDSCIQFCIPQKTILIDACTNIGSIYVTIYKEAGWGYELVYTAIDDSDINVFKDFLLESAKIKICTLDSPRLKKVKGKTAELTVDLERNPFTKLILTCLRFFKGDFPSKFDVILKKGEKPCLKLSKEISMSLSILNFFHTEVSDITILPRGFECDLKVSVQFTKESQFTGNIRAKYQNNTLSGSVQLKKMDFKILPGLRVKDLSLGGQFWPHPRLYLSSCCQVLDYPDDMTLQYCPPSLFSLVFPVDFHLKFSNILKIVLNVSLPVPVQGLLDFMRIEPIKEGESIRFGFQGSTCFNISAKLVILEFIKLNIEIDVDIFTGIDAKVWLNPIKLGSILSITAADSTNKGPELLLKVLPLRNEYEVKASGQFNFLGLKMLSYFKLSTKGLEFRLEAGFHMGSLFGIETEVNVIIGRDQGFYFKTFFLFYLNIETPRIELWGFDIPSIHLCGVGLRAEVELSNKRFRIKGKVVLSILATEVTVEVEMDIEYCDIVELPSKIVKWIIQNWWKFLKNLGKVLLNGLWNILKGIGKVVLMIFTNPIKFLKSLFTGSWKGSLGESGGGDGSKQKGEGNENEGSEIDMGKAQQLINKAAKQCVRDGKYDEAFTLYEASESAGSQKGNDRASRDNSQVSEGRIMDMDTLRNGVKNTNDPGKKIAYLKKLQTLADKDESNKISKEVEKCEKEMKEQDKQENRKSGDNNNNNGKNNKDDNGGKIDGRFFYGMSSKDIAEVAGDESQKQDALNSDNKKHTDQKSKEEQKYNNREHTSIKQNNSEKDPKYSRQDNELSDDEEDKGDNDRKDSKIPTRNFMNKNELKKDYKPRGGGFDDFESKEKAKERDNEGRNGKSISEIQHDEKRSSVQKPKERRDNEGPRTKLVKDSKASNQDYGSSGDSDHEQNKRDEDGDENKILSRSFMNKDDLKRDQKSGDEGLDHIGKGQERGKGLEGQDGTDAKSKYDRRTDDDKFQEQDDSQGWKEESRDYEEYKKDDFARYSEDFGVNNGLSDDDQENKGDEYEKRNNMILDREFTSKSEHKFEEIDSPENKEEVKERGNRQKGQDNKEGREMEHQGRGKDRKVKIEDDNKIEDKNENIRNLYNELLAIGKDMKKGESGQEARQESMELSEAEKELVRESELMEVEQLERLLKEYEKKNKELEAVNQKIGLNEGNNNQKGMKSEEEKKKDGCVCGKPLRPTKDRGVWQLKPVCICGKDGLQVVKKGGMHGNIHGFNT